MLERWLRPVAGLGALLTALGIATSPFAQERNTQERIAQERIAQERIAEQRTAEERTSRRLSPATAMEALKQGGYIIYFRHFETGADTPDQHLARFDDCATQRQLDEQGVRQAVRVRNAVQAMRIPVGEVLASPFCRAWQSADLAFGRHVKVEGLKLPPSKDYTDADRIAMRVALQPLLGRPPMPGTNTIIMAHDDNLPAAGGPEIKTQGEAVIIRPDGSGGFDVVALIKPARWAGASSRR
jgi:hypothetical protein